jgi:hypothetical protein
MAKVTQHAIVGKVRWEAIGGGKIRVLDNWAVRNVVSTFIPQLKGVPTYGGEMSGNIRFYAPAIPQLKAAFEEIEEKGLLEDIIFWGGSFVPRMVRGSTRTPSNHTFGTAFDINPDQNGLGATSPPVGKRGSVRRLVAIFKKYGFFWGGDYKRRSDPMHFEVLRILSASEIAALRGNGGDIVVEREAVGKPVVKAQKPQDQVIIVRNGIDQRVLTKDNAQGILIAAGVEISQLGTWEDGTPAIYVK